MIAGLILLNGLFSMSELAIVSARPARLKIAAERGSSGARAALALADNPGKFLSTVQIGITLVGIVAGAYSGASLGGPTGDRLAALLRKSHWFHYSVDYRIGTRHMGEYIVDNFKAEVGEDGGGVEAIGLVGSHRRKPQ